MGSISDTEHVHVVQFQSHIKEARKNIEMTFPDMFLEVVESPGEGLNLLQVWVWQSLSNCPTLFCAVPECAGHWHPGAITGSRTASLKSLQISREWIGDRGGPFPVCILSDCRELACI